MGQRFAGRYELVDHLGDGGSGTVWRAWDERTGSYVAAKLLRQRDAAALLRFVREQSLRVQHPHVLAPTGWAAEDDDVLLTMRLVAGGSVATLLADYGALPVGLVLVLLDQLLDALEAVHAAGIVHRDVTPTNLLLEATGGASPVLRLADFGIAVLGSDQRLTDTGMVVGTPGYVAPEALVPRATPDARQDLYAAGVVGHRLRAGPAPVPAAAGPVALPEPTRDIPPDVVGWLVALTDADPQRRPASAAAAREGLRSLPSWQGAVGPWRDANGEPIEVFNHLPELPAGWGAQGPTSGAAPAAPAMVAPGGAAVTLPPDATRQATVPDAAGPADDRRLPAGGRWARNARLAAGVALLTLGVAALVAAVVSGTGGASRPAGGSPTPAAGSAGATSPAAATGARVTPGAACTFTQVGQRRPADAGSAMCSERAGAYTWVAVP